MNSGLIFDTAQPVIMVRVASGEFRLVKTEYILETCKIKVKGYIRSDDTIRG